MEMIINRQSPWLLNKLSLPFAIFLFFLYILRDKGILLTEFEVHTVSYGLSFIHSDLWPKHEERRP